MEIGNESYFILVCAGLSTIGCLLIIISGLCLKKLRTYAFRLIIYLSIADLFASISKSYIGFILPGYSSSFWCYSQALIQNFSQLASLLITLLISASLYGMIVKENFQIKKHEKFLVFLCFLIPALATPLPLITKSYGDSNGWCWIGYKNAYDTFWMLFEFYAPLIGLLITNMYLYCRIYQKIWRDLDLDKNSKVVKKLLSRLKMYPVVLVICFGPSLVHRFYYLMNGSDSTVLNIISGCLSALYGLGNMIVYGFTGKVRKSLRSALTKFFQPSADSSASTTLIV